MKKVSVIMGVYNSKNKKQLSDSIESILSQTFDYFEFIIYNDGSVDDTLEVLKRYESQDNRIIVLSNDKNNGLAYSLNKCIERATGEYIARMDSDDISVANRLEKQVTFLSLNKEISIVGSNAYLIDDNGVWGNRLKPEKPTKKYFYKGTPFIHPTVMIKSDVYKKLHGYSVEKTTLRLEDFDFFMRAYSMGYLGANIQESLLYYREDLNAYKKRLYKYRVDELKIRLRGYKSLGMLPLGYVFAIKPLIVGLIPNKLLIIYRKWVNR